ncbi:MAG: hypothetical protein PWP23_1090, partial [Candidatus Sumerlaeota bacterium]|nr:hypothetical protein [Candidatus Sumerlaeota bacterium]
MSQKHALHQSGGALRLLTLLAAVLALALSLETDAAVPHWAPMSGTLDFEVYSNYGEMGVPRPGNHPSARKNPACWNDDEGGFWFFGGFELEPTLLLAFRNDLWRFSPASNTWTWMAGTTERNPHGVYGVRGTPGAANTPGGRYQNAAWRDSDGCLWLFGGSGYAAEGFNTKSLLNDLWKYDPRLGSWVWMAGSDKPNQAGVYGLVGVPTPSNTPGARAEATCWTDPRGRFWLFGGNGVGGTHNDLWMYDPGSEQWTWMAGSEDVNMAGAYGDLGVPSPSNTPGSRTNGVGWPDSQGRLWLFGGSGMDMEGARGFLSDLWMYDPELGEWTWMKGSAIRNQQGISGMIGQPDPTSVPGARCKSLAWTSESGELWLFGGEAYSSSGFAQYPADLWKYDLSTGNWTLVTEFPAEVEQGALGVYSKANSPGSRWSNHAWTDEQGAFRTADPSRWDFWSLNPALLQWSALKVRPEHPQPALHGEQGTPAVANTPGSRQGSGTWADAEGTQWLFGGDAPEMIFPYIPSLHNDLWRFDPPTRTWTWIKGSKEADRPGVYGTVLTPEAGNTPGGRRDPATWSDANGGLWLFGGYGCDGQGRQTSLNDLWRFDVSAGNWTWMGGPSVAEPPLRGVYGSKGVPHPSNLPGPRRSSVTWQDLDGGFWLFGGKGYDGSGWEGELNDLWRYDLESGNWTWMSGSSARNQAGSYGAIETYDSLNNPGGRSAAVSWTDPDGNLWLFGGTGYDGLGSSGVLDDVWKYDLQSGEWSWRAGGSTRNQPTVAGEQGRSSPSNTPGGRYGAVAWMHEGLFWLFGGDSAPPTSTSRFRSDLWCFDPQSEMWTWYKGPLGYDESGVGSVYGVSDSSNTPGARRFAVSWKSTSDELWLYGGDGYDLSGCRSLLGDMWRATFSKPHADEEPGPGDVLVLTEFTDAWVSRLQGGGLAAPAHLGFIGFRHDTAANWSTLAGDFDGDGFIDLVTITADGEAWTATFDAPDAYSVPNKQSSGWYADPALGFNVLAGDFNGDGLTDL